MEDALVKVEKVELIPDTYREIPATDFSSLGAAGSSLHQFVQSIARPGGEGIYRVTFPQGFKNMTLSKFNDEQAFMGSGLVDGSFKQARLNQIPCDPTQMFIAMALMSISSKLSEISAVQREILSFMFDVEESKLAGNLNILNKMVEDYKLNSGNQTFLDHMLEQAGNIKREAAQSEELYKKQILNILDTKADSIHVVSEANDKVNKLRRNMRDYHLAFYIRSYTEFLEVFLINNFSEENLSHVQDCFLSEKAEYDALYSKCYEWAKKYMNSAIGHHIAAPALKGFDEGYAKVLSHIPGGLDRHFTADAQKYVSAETQLKRISKDKKSGTMEFMDSIKQMKKLQNEPVEMYLEGETVYIADGKEEK